MGVDVVAPFQFITQIGTVNPARVIVGHKMNFAIFGYPVI